MKGFELCTTQSVSEWLTAMVQGMPDVTLDLIGPGSMYGDHIASSTSGSGRCSDRAVKGIANMKWIAAAILSLAVFPPAAHAQDDHKRVLVLFSTRRDVQFSAVGENELPKLLDVGLARNIDYHSEFIDVTRFPEPAYREGFSNFLRLKYRGVRFDLVIAMQDAATAFIDSYGDSLFRDSPVVFLTNHPQTPHRTNVTGLVHRRNFAATVRLIQQLQPDVREVFIVTGNATADEQLENEVRRQLQSSDSGLTFTYLSGLATSDLEARLAKLPPHSAVYHVRVTEDGAGNKYHPIEYVDRVAAAANAPTYSWVDSAMDHGIVGGNVYIQRAAIQHVGELALRVLHGESADSIPLAALDLNETQVDWRQLRRWGIDEARLPVGTQVRFRNPTIWDRYKAYILGTVALFITQTMLITGLLIQRKRRRRAEEELRTNQDELRQSYERNRDLAARLLKAQETERSRIAGELHDDICQRMLVLTVELELLGRARSEGPATEALSVAREISKSLHDLSHRLHPTRLRMIGLAAALEQLCLDLSRAGVAIEYRHDNLPRTLPSDVMLCLFRVVQEALQNAVKYSHATHVSVRAQNGPNELSLTIIDDGAGFDIDAAWGKGVGLISMVERLDAIGGALDIRSGPKAGTRVTATIPAAVVHTRYPAAARFAPEEREHPTVHESHQGVGT
jgi:signal transduction histidine kinase